MSQLAALWDLILKSNTFNFAILVVIFVILCQKLKVGDMIGKIRAEIISEIEDAKSVRERAEGKFADAKSKVAHVEEEVAEKFKSVEDKARLLVNSVEQNAEFKIRQIEGNTARIILAEEKNIKNLLGKNTANSAVELAKRYIKNRLEQDVALQEKYIDESLQELDRIDLQNG